MKSEPDEKRVMVAVEIVLNEQSKKNVGRKHQKKNHPPKHPPETENSHHFPLRTAYAKKGECMRDGYSYCN